MRSSRPEATPTRRHTILMRIVKALVFVGLAVLVNVGLTLALEPYGNPTDAAWYEYRTATAAGEQIDTLFIGSSFGRRDVNPYRFDEQLGSDSFSLATPSQALYNSLASLQTGARDHDLKRAVMLIGPETFEGEAWFKAQVTFLQAKSEGESVPDILQNVARLAFDPQNFPTTQSLTWALPWIHSSVDHNLDAVMENINRRLTVSDPIEAYRLADPNTVYVGKGHGNYEGTFDFTTAAPSEYSFTNEDSFEQQNLDDFTRILDYAEQQGIELYVIVAPRPAYTDLAHANDNYAHQMASLQELVESHGGVYFDVNLAKRDFYHAEEDEFVDAQHLNLEAADRFSDVLGALIAQYEAGEDTDELFWDYDEWDEYIASHDVLELCYLEHEDASDAITFEAHAIAQPDAQVEYQFEVQTGDEDWEVVRNWDTGPTYRLTLDDAHGNVRVRLTARVVDEDEDFERTYETDVSY